MARWTAGAGAFALPLLLACGGRNCGGSPPPASPGDAATAPAEASSPVEAAAPLDAARAEMGDADSATDTAPLARSGPCETQLDADREATTGEILALVLPGSKGNALPVRRPPPRAGASPSDLPYLVEPCLGLPHESLTPPSIGRVDRLAIDGERELVQFPVGTEQGLIEYKTGLRVLLERRGRAVRVLAIDEVTGHRERGLEPYKRARLGAVEVLLQPWSAGLETEQYETGTYVNVDVVRGTEVTSLGWMTETRASHDPFWQGSYEWTMTSPGIEPDDAGFVVKEHWTFTHRTTHKKTTRDLTRAYRLAAGKLVSVPPFRLEAWPETTPAPSP